mmetsp:Transcript_40340/g.121533  ORF Transcript_40340/g.121533 Transcript_40340/m.121533 type:complete len:436 (+) Transcript_40340:846-2153(+)
MLPAITSPACPLAATGCSAGKLMTGKTATVLSNSSSFSIPSGNGSTSPEAWSLPATRSRNSRAAPPANSSSEGDAAIEAYRGGGRGDLALAAPPPVLPFPNGRLGKASKSLPPPPPLPPPAILSSGRPMPVPSVDDEDVAPVSIGGSSPLRSGSLRDDMTGVLMVGRNGAPPVVWARWAGLIPLPPLPSAHLSRGSSGGRRWPPTLEFRTGCNGATNGAPDLGVGVTSPARSSPVRDALGGEYDDPALHSSAQSGTSGRTEMLLTGGRAITATAAPAVVMPSGRSPWPLLLWSFGACISDTRAEMSTSQYSRLAEDDVDDTIELDSSSSFSFSSSPLFPQSDDDLPTSSLRPRRSPEASPPPSPDDLNAFVSAGPTTLLKLTSMSEQSTKVCLSRREGVDGATGGPSPEAGLSTMLFTPPLGTDPNVPESARAST